MLRQGAKAAKEANRLKNYKFITNALRFEKMVDGPQRLCYSLKCNTCDITVDSKTIPRRVSLD